MVTSHLRSGGRYPVLRSLGILYLIFGAVFAVAGIIAAVYFILRGPGNWTDRFFEMCAALAATAFAVLTMLAIAELLKLFIDLEHNTRMAWMNTPSAAATTAGTAAAVATITVGSADGGRINRLAGVVCADEETAEGALIRGH